MEKLINHRGTANGFSQRYAEACVICIICALLFLTSKIELTSHPRMSQTGMQKSTLIFNQGHG